MNNLASSYSALGRHQEVLELWEKTLELQRRAHPDDDPAIGEEYAV